MKTWYLLVVLAVSGLSFNTVKTAFLRKPFSRRNNNFRVLRFFRISADPASGAYRKHSQASGLPKPIPLGIPRPISRQKWIGLFFHSVLYYFHIWNPWNLKLSISASCSQKKLNRPKPTPEQRSRGLDAVILHEILLRVFLFKGKFKYFRLVNFQLLMGFNWFSCSWISNKFNSLASNQFSINSISFCLY